MARKSNIEWTDMTWNPVTGCTKVSPGCKHCYAETMAKRLKAMGSPRYADGFKLTLQPDLLDLPFRWRTPRRVFVNSMSDLFHSDVPDDYILRVFDTMNRAQVHQFQILTKRPERVLSLDARLPWTTNIWMGTSVESAEYLERIDLLRVTSAHTKFLSLEPLLGPLPLLPLTGMHWVIVGGESGPHARPMKRAWVIDIRKQCRKAEVAFFFKQWGGVNKHRTGRQLDGHVYNEMPTADGTAFPVLAE
ncbi:MAG: phage Gp37/Gp68 family protein [Phycisphaeraceae bacterium]